MTTENNVAAQAGDFEKFDLTKQVPITYGNSAQIAVQAGDEPMRAAFEVWALDYFFYDKCRQDGEYVHPDMHTHWLAYRAGRVSPRATADVEREKLMMQCLFSIAAGHTYTDNQESLHCSTCNADLDDGEEHSATCLTVRAGEYIATTKPGALPPEPEPESRDDEDWFFSPNDD